MVLIVLDGYGVSTRDPESTRRYSKCPNFEYLEKFFPFATLQASGSAVGLPWGEEGNSEVGHLTMGAGRIIYSHLPRIIASIRDGSFFKNPAFQKTAEHVKKNNSRLHLCGLFSSGSVHAYAEHLYALLDFAGQNELKEVYLHLFTDGRDSPLDEAAGFFTDLESLLSQKYPFARIASVIGRSFAMDRDGHWDLIEKAYRLLTEGEGAPFQSPAAYIEKHYSQNVFDEFVGPGFRFQAGQAVGRIEENDAVIFFSYREDSARELAAAFMLEKFGHFQRKKISNLFFATMTAYSPDFPAEVAYPAIDIAMPLAKIISNAGLRQLHIAETEKYAHVTYFFNGGKENPFPGEDRFLVPSLPTAHFDEHPEMSAAQITEKVLTMMDNYDFILVNFANADMVGHTGSFEATVKALEVLDFSVGQIIPKVLEKGGAAIITADHGNAEEKLYRQTGEIRSKHTTNPVLFFIAADKFKFQTEKSEKEIAENYQKTIGMLTDVAPTALDLLGLPIPKEMTGVSLLPKLIPDILKAKS